MGVYSVTGCDVSEVGSIGDISVEALSYEYHSTISIRISVYEVLSSM